MIHAVLMVALGAPTPAINQAMALRGGALMIPLTGAPSRGGWPDTMQVHLRSPHGTQSLEAMVAWLEPVSQAVRYWGADPQPLHLRRIQALDGQADAIGPGLGPQLLLSLPMDGVGNLDIAGAVVRLQWRELPEAMPDLRLDVDVPLQSPPMLTPSASTPGPGPFERWRWELLCAADGMQAPQLPEEILRRLATLHVVGPWRVLMHDLAKADRGVAREVLERLTLRIMRDDTAMAAWETNHTRLAELFLGQTGLASTRAQAALAWAEAAVPLTAWLESPLQLRPTLVLTNGTVQPCVVELAWAQPDEIPTALRVQGHQLRLEPVDRSAGPQVLALQTGAVATGLAVSPMQVSPEPPGQTLGPFLGTMTLLDAQLAAPPPPPNVHRQTWAHIRRVLGRWEILLDCGRPAGVPDAPAPAGVLSVDELRGHDAVLLRLHVDGQEIPIVVHAQGWYSARGEVSRLEVRTARRGDAWITRVILPEHWTRRHFGVEMIRTHAGDRAIETAVMAGTPWAALPGPLDIDVSGWDQGLELR